MFESRGDGTAPVSAQSTIAAYGITMMPEEPGNMACPMFHLFLWPPSGALFGGAYNPENNTTRATRSCRIWKGEALRVDPEYQDIRKMITSLRPAGE